MGFFSFIRLSLLFITMIIILEIVTLLLGFPLWIALLFGGIFTFISYWWSDSLVLKITRAQIITESQFPELYQMVRKLSQKANMPMPKVAIVENPTPNAFATGRSPGRAVVAVHTGLLNMMNREELEGVLAHEISHIKHWDTLIMCMAGLIAASIAIMARIALFSAIFGDRRDSAGLIGIVIAWIIAPIAAIAVQLAISRAREYEADKGAAKLTGNPHGLASALYKLGHASQRIPPRYEANQGLSHLYISNPLSQSSLNGLFATHPPIEERIRRLERMN